MERGTKMATNWYDKWFDMDEAKRNRIVEKIADAYINEDYDKYEDLLEKYSHGDCKLYNRIEDTAIEFVEFGSHEIG